MNVILDECLPRKLGLVLTGHEVTTVQQVGWAGILNGKLLKRIAGNYDVFVTVDQNLTAQQNTRFLPFGILVLRTPTNRLADLQTLAPKILAALRQLSPGKVMIVSDQDHNR